MKIITVIILFFTSCIFAQKIEIGDVENQLKTFNYVLDNLDKIKRENNEEILYVTLEFNKNHFIKKSTFFSCNEQNLRDENKKEIQISNELKKFIEKTFSFFSYDIFYSNNTGESGLSFFLPLSKINLEKEIKNMKNELNDYYQNTDKKGIILDSKFNIQITNLYFDKTKFNDKNEEGILNKLNSPLIEIAPNLYFIFRIIKTNEFVTNNATDYFEYKIMYLNGTFSELLVSHRFNVRSKEIKISEIPTHTINGNLSNSIYCDSDENESLSRKFEDIKFLIKIQFQK